jgi:hypothetical protein
VIEKRL